MKTKVATHEPQGLRLGLIVLAVGIAIGLVARPGDWLPGASETPGSTDEQPEHEQASEVELQVPMSRGPGESAVAEAYPAALALPTLHIDVAPEHAEVLQRVYDRSQETGMIVKQEDDLVPATVRHDAKLVEGKVRIKGDYLDHLNTDKWSLRVELESDKLFGMRRFSIQHPKTRGHLWEWFIMTVCRRDGLLTPRVDYVNVVINGNPLGVYYLEEHFTKELLESQGRREGPIVRFDEAVMMSVFEKYITPQDHIPYTVRPGYFPNAAEVGAFGEKRLAQSENLSRMLERAIQKLNVLQAGVLRHALVAGSPSAVMQAVQRAGGETMETAFDFDAAARMHAIFALFRCKHGMGWKDRHFYFNPITDRLEPIINDTMAGLPIPARDPVAMFTFTNQAFQAEPDYVNRLFLHLAEVADPDYLTGVFEELEDDLRRYSAIMAAEGIVDVQTDVDAMKEMLWDQQTYLAELLHPNEPISFDSRLLGGTGPGGELHIEAWATSKVPVVMLGFRFENGRFLAARRVLAAESSGLTAPPGIDSAVVLPHDGRHGIFRFPADLRLSALEDVEAIKSAIVNATEKDKSAKLAVTAEYRLLTASAPSARLLALRRFGTDWAAEGGRPQPPALEEALGAHPFLALDPGRRELVITAGTWDVEGDLVVPAGYPLRAEPGSTLHFQQGRGLVSTEALHFVGDEGAPVVLAPREGAASWAGVAVLEAPEQSTWSRVQVRDTDVFRRGGWMMTGGVTFYRSPVELRDCLLEDAHGEDALNIYGTEFTLDGVVIDRVASDAFDGDFVRGEVRGCTFLASVEDAVDVSGSDVDVVDCRFIDIGDKAISAGEDSVVRARDCVVESASIGLASKDYSRLVAQDIEIQRVVNYAIAVYIKKPEFGPSSVIADRISIGEAGLGTHIVQRTCELLLEGQRIPGIEVDVKEMYRQKILGQ